MSGGSFRYLYSSLQDNPFDHYGDLEKMIDWLREKGKIEAADRLQRLYNLLLESQNKIEKEISSLSPVMYKAEWWCSGDSGEEQFDKAWKNYSKLEDTLNDIKIRVHGGK